jgi:hypothetical protein
MEFRYPGVRQSDGKEWGSEMQFLVIEAENKEHADAIYKWLAHVFYKRWEILFLKDDPDGNTEPIMASIRPHNVKVSLMKGT